MNDVSKVFIVAIVVALCSRDRGNFDARLRHRRRRDARRIVVDLSARLPIARQSATRATAPGVSRTPNLPVWHRPSAPAMLHATTKDTMDNPTPTTRQKALALNLDGRSYGTFAEIGAGQEVARTFFAAGGAAGTIAKSISAYDMAVSDAMYGRTQRYVSRQRLEAMLELELSQLVRDLGDVRGDSKCFFAFANTVATRRFGSAESGRGWLGVRFQAHARAEPSEVIIHVHLLDREAAHEQEALGVVGVNLIYGAFFMHDAPERLIASLLDELSREQVEIDMVKFSGPAFTGVDNRLMSLQLVERGLTDAAMFTAAGDVVQPSEVLYKKAILVERGSFRPATNLTLDLLERAMEAFSNEPAVRQHGTPVILAEMTLRSLTPGAEARHEDFLARAEILHALGFGVLISRFEQYYYLAEYLARYTEGPIGLAVGLPAIRLLIDENYYENLAGGFLESVGRLFKRSVRMYVYPTRDPVTGRVQTWESVQLPAPWQHLHRLLMELGHIVPIRPSDESYLSIQTPEVLARIERDDPSWEQMVPLKVAQIIKANQLFRRPA
jgi:hypothetical protein